MFKHILIGSGLLTTAACGGSTYEGPSITPVSSSGFATANSSVEDVATFSLLGQTRIVSGGANDGSDFAFATQDITLTRIEDADGEADQIEVTIDGQTFTLNKTGESDYAFSDDDNDVFVGPLLTAGNDAAVYEIFATLNGNLNASNVVVGLDTNPDIVGARSGSAEYNGEVQFTSRTGFTDAIGNGDIVLDVNFNDMTIGGFLSLRGSGNSASETDIPNLQFDIIETSINDNGFETVLSYNDMGDEVAGTNRSSPLNGRFYGANGGTLGGQFSTEYQQSDNDNLTLIEGAYLATE